MDEERNNPPSLGLIKFLLIVIAIGICYLCYVEFQGSQSIDATPAVLILYCESDYASDDDLSDTTQIRNALADGGMISVKIDNDWLRTNFGAEYTHYGASNADGYHYTLGALLNYIASQGWTLVQAPSSGLSEYFYFTR